MANITVTPIRTFTSGETVTPTKLNELSEPTVALTAGTIVAADLASDAVTNAKLASGIDAAKLTTGTLPADRIGSSAITTARINNGSVTAAKLDGAQAGSAPIYGVRAWVSFDGTRNVTDTGASSNGNPVKILAAGNVSSVEKVAVGKFKVIFATAMSDVNYAVSGVTDRSGSPTGSSLGLEPGTVGTNDFTVTCTRFATTSISLNDAVNNHVMVIR